MTPESLELPLGGVAHHVYRWGDGPGPRWLCFHGFLDQGDSFGALAQGLAEAGGQVWAVDFRGHGRSGWAPPGSYYHFPDYVRDVQALRAAVPELGGTIRLVGHSMGGTVATYYAGTRPDAVERLVLMEGLGPRGRQPDDAAERMVMWLASMERYTRSRPRMFVRVEDASERLQRSFPELSAAVCQDFAARLLKPCEGGWTWRYDPLHRTDSPAPFLSAAYQSFAERVRCPVLTIAGDCSPFARADDPDLQRRIAALGGAHTNYVVAGAGHMMHLSHPDECATEILRWAAAAEG